MAKSLFTIPTRAGREQDSAIAKKVNSQTQTKSSITLRGGGGLIERINMIRAMVEKSLGQYADDYIVIQDANELHEYISKVLENGIISIDTETTGLDPLQDELVGMSIYTPGMKAAYIPIHHKSYITHAYVDGQLPVYILHDEFQRIADSDAKVIMFNACFDIRVLRSGINVYLTCYWDCYLAARLMNENEGSGNNGLKKLHNKYVLNGMGDAFKFDDLYKGITFDLVPISAGYTYAAHDADITYQLYEFQKQYMYYEPDKPHSDRNGMNGVAWVFFNIEMPCVQVVADIEDTGVAFDNKFADELHDKYHADLEEKSQAVYKLINMYADELAMFRSRHPDTKLEDPVNIDSPSQLAILFYDVIGTPVVDPEKPRGTGEDILVKMNTPLAKAILEYREIQKLINTYIDKLPSCINPKDGRIHCKFNQYGADTGRLSSQDPNLQNIPSHNKEIRKMFRATDGYYMISADYSQQEIKVMAQMCGDKGMLQSFRDGKDFYAQIASVSFNQPYEECLEFRPDGTTNKAGKERRSQAKSILLGINYGRGVASIAEQLKTTKEAAQKIKDSVFKGFPAIPKFEKDSMYLAETYGYVPTLWGRKRRLPVMLKPDYEFKWTNGTAPDDDPLSFDISVETEVPERLKRKYLAKLNKAWGSQKKSIFLEANEEGIWIVDNTKDKADAGRQVVNARIQGSAADMSKLAMIKCGTDERLKELGFRILIPVHDELIGECPKENIKEVVDRFTHLMNTAPGDKFTIPISCDAEVSEQWYGDSVQI